MKMKGKLNCRKTELFSLWKKFARTAWIFVHLLNSSEIK